MTVYLCTCGTSSNKNIPRDQKFGPEWVTSQGCIENAAKVLYNSFSMYHVNDDKALIQHLSAEVHSLARLGLKATDRVVLYSSETPDGQTCALAVQQYLQQELPGLECKVDVITGLQVRNADTFRRIGVIGFIQNVPVTRSYRSSATAKANTNRLSAWICMKPVNPRAN